MGNLRISNGFDRMMNLGRSFSGFFFAGVIICIAATGCNQEKSANFPPAATTVFSLYPSGANLGPEPGVVIIPDSIVSAENIPDSILYESPICYRVYDEGEEIVELTGTSYNGFCPGAKPYNTGLYFTCDGKTTTTTKVLQLWFQWDNNGYLTNEEYIAEYTLDCVEPAPGAVRYRVSGGGDYTGALDGRIDIIDGFAIMDPGVLKNPAPAEGSGLSLYEAGTATFESTVIMHTYDDKVAPNWRALDFDTTRQTTVSGSWDSVTESFFMFSAVDVAATCQTRGIVAACGFANVGVEVNIIHLFDFNPIDFDNTYSAGPPEIQGITEFTIAGIISVPGSGQIMNATTFMLKALPH